MAKIYGNITATPIKPDLFTTTVDQTYDPNSENAISGKAVKEAISNKPTIYEGTKIVGFASSNNGNIFGKSEFAVGGNTVGEFWLNLKVGDLYYNTDTKKTYLCLSVDINDKKNLAQTTWKDLNLEPDTVYDSTSKNAQSGEAVAEAIGRNNAEIDNAINANGNNVLQTSKEYTNSRIDQTFISNSENAVSGKALGEVVGGIDQYIYDTGIEATQNAKNYTDEKIGDIDAVLDSILAIQNSYIGGDA